MLCVKPELIALIRAVIQAEGSVSLKQGIPNFIFVGFIRRAVTVSSNRERQCFPYQSIKVQKAREKKENLHLHTQESSEKK